MSRKRSHSPGTPGQEEGLRVNPFERRNLENLQHSVWSPGVFANVNMATPPQNGWTIDQLAVLFPKAVEDSPSSHMNEYPLDSEAKAKAQADIDKFFSSGPIAPSPIEEIPKKRGLYMGQAPEEMTMTDVPATTTAATITNISIPWTTKDARLEALLAQFMTTTEFSGSVPESCIPVTKEPEPIVNVTTSTSFTSLAMNTSFSNVPMNTSFNKVPRRRLDLSFGDTSEDDCSQPSTDENAIPTMQDPFSQNHEMMSPLTRSFNGSSNSASLSVTDIREKFQRCEFTPDSINTNMQIGTPEITPIQDQPTEFLAITRHQHIEKDNWSYSSTPKGQRGYAPRTGFRRYKSYTETAVEFNPTAKSSGLVTEGQVNIFFKASSDTVDKTENEVPDPRKLQALGIRIVLENIFQRLDLSDLMECRLVCKAWFEASSVSFKKKSMCVPMIRNGTDDATPVLNCSVSMFSHAFSENVLSPFPYENLYISDYAEYSEAKVKILDESAFFSMFLSWGTLLKNLRFELKKQEAENKCETLLKILTEWCPNLEEIELENGEHLIYQKLNLGNTQLPNLKRLLFRDARPREDSQSYQPVDQENIIAQVEEIFKAGPNIESVNVSSECHCLTYSVASTVAKHGQNLKTLCWNNLLLERELKVLGQTPGDFNLTRLELSCTLFPFQSTVQNMFGFLSRTSKTLETFHLNGDIVESYEIEDNDHMEIPGQVDERRELNFLKVKFPKMSKLRVLVLRDIFHCRLNTLDFVLNLPNLKKLVLHNVGYASVVYPFRPDELFNKLLDNSMELLHNPHETLRDLDLHGEILTGGFVDMLSKCFPNLKVLDLFVNTSAIFSEVLRNFKTLEELKLRFIPTSFDECNASLITFLSKMTELKKLTLTNAGPHHFALSKRIIEESFETMKKIQRLEFVKCSILQYEYDEILEILKHCGIVVFKSCVVTTLAPLDAAYLNGKRQPFLNHNILA